MSHITLTLLTVTLLLAGAYAGMTFMCQIAVLPALRAVSLPAYADMFRAMDVPMARLMPPYKLTLLAVNLATVILLRHNGQSSLAIAAGICFLLTVTGLVLTITRQVPLNTQLAKLPADAPEAVLLELREQTVSNFAVRNVVALLAFLSLTVGVVFFR